MSIVASPIHYLESFRNSDEGAMISSPPCRAATQTQIFNGSNFEVDPATGFFPPQPVPRLTGEFTLWEDMLSQARTVLALDGDTREQANVRRPKGEAWRAAIRNLKPLNYEALQGKPTLRRAHVVLAFILHFYVHSHPRTFDMKGNPRPIVVPKSITAPFMHVSQAVGLPPIITFADTVLWNWELIDPSRPLSLDNMRYTNLFSGEDTEANFYRLSATAEFKGVELMQIIGRHMNLPRPADAMAVATIARDLHRLAECLDELTTIMNAASKSVDPYTFYWIVRRWWNGPSSDTSRPWVFEGSSNPALGSLGGASAGQSSVLHAVDVYLDVDHALKKTRLPEPSAENRRSDSSFMDKMRSYMPAEHRGYLTALMASPVRDDVERTPSLREPYNAAVAALKRFRDVHIRIATLFIITQARTTPPEGIRAPGTSKTAEGHERGTGGNPVAALLKAGRDATARTLLRSE